MILLDTVNKSLEVILGGAVTTNQLPFVVSYVDVDQTTLAASSPASADGVTNGASAVTIVGVPGSGKTRKIMFISIPNADTAAATVTVQLNNNGTTRRLWKGALSVGDNLEYTA